jgi:ATP-dependent exoDNAse (exonuclease V) beta subunit
MPVASVQAWFSLPVRDIAHFEQTGLPFDATAISKAAIACAQEEDRILYVAMTRARERLLLSGGVDIGKWHQLSSSAGPISWLGRALEPELPGRLETEQSPLQLPLGAGGAVVRCSITSPASPPQSPHPPPAAPGGASPGRAAGAVVREPRATPVPAIATLSYTALSELERCGYRYYLQRVLGLPESPGHVDIGGHGLAARERGTLIHRLLELVDFSAGRPPSAQDVARAAEELGMRPGAQERAEISGLIAAALAAAPAAILAQATELRREHPFAFSPGPGEPLITGVLDLLASTGEGSLLVVDYKSDGVAPEDDLEALVERDYSVQRLLYALAVLRGGAERVQVAHWFLARPGQWAQAEYRAQDRAALEGELASRLAPVTAGAGAFAVSKTPHRGLCLTCPGRSGLCSWGDEHTLRDDPQADIGGLQAPGLA